MSVEHDGDQTPPLAVSFCKVLIRWAFWHCFVFLFSRHVWTCEWLEDDVNFVFRRWIIPTFLHFRMRMGTLACSILAADFHCFHLMRKIQVLIFFPACQYCRKVYFDWFYFQCDRFVFLLQRSLGLVNGRHIAMLCSMFVGLR